MVERQEWSPQTVSSFKNIVEADMIVPQFVSVSREVFRSVRQSGPCQVMEASPGVSSNGCLRYDILPVFESSLGEM